MYTYTLNFTCLEYYYGHNKTDCILSAQYRMHTNTSAYAGGNTFILFSRYITEEEREEKEVYG